MSVFPLDNSAKITEVHRTKTNAAASMPFANGIAGSSFLSSQKAEKYKKFMTKATTPLCVFPPPHPTPSQFYRLKRGVYRLEFTYFATIYRFVILYTLPETAAAL